MYATRMPFGKHEGVPLSEIPGDYLAWVLNTLHRLSPELRRAIGAELRSRQSCQSLAAEPQAVSRNVLPVEDVRSLWSTIFRRMALAVHPDRGGSVRAMAELNECHELISEQLELAER